MGRPPPLQPYPLINKVLILLNYCTLTKSLFSGGIFQSFFKLKMFLSVLFLLFLSGFPPNTSFLPASVLLQFSFASNQIFQ